MRTVVGFFDKYREAEGLVNELVERGFDRQNIEIGRTAKRESETGKKREDFLDWLFAAPGEKHEGVRGYYPEGPHGEEAYVAIYASDTEAMLARDIMSSHGVADIGERPSP